MFISTVIPAYDECENLEVLTPRLVKALRELDVDHEIIYVIQGNDGSTELIERMKNDIPELRYIAHPSPLGVGRAFRTGFAEVDPRADYVLTMDADLNHRPEELERFVRAVRANDPDIVVGSRRALGGVLVDMPPFKRIVSDLTTKALNVTLGRNAVTDMTSGYRLYRRSVLDEIFPCTRSKDFEFYPEILMLAIEQERTITEVPITFTMRIHGLSKLNWYASAKGYARLLSKRVF